MYILCITNTQNGNRNNIKTKIPIPKMSKNTIKLFLTIKFNSQTTHDIFSNIILYINRNLIILDKFNKDFCTD